jgi:hypothetical protein
VSLTVPGNTLEEINPKTYQFASLLPFFEKWSKRIIAEEGWLHEVPETLTRHVLIVLLNHPTPGYTITLHKPHSASQTLAHLLQPSFQSK